MTDDSGGVSRRAFILSTTGAGAVGAAGAAVGQENNNTTAGGPSQPGGGGNTSAGEGGNESSGNATDGNETSDGGGGGGGETHTVGMSGVSFEPSEITVAPGDTVVWENSDSQGHTVTAYGDDIPDGAEYFASGDFEDEDTARSNYPDGTLEPDDTYEHTFQTEGAHEYFCIPHESAGMVGTVQVSEGGGGGGGGGGGQNVPQIPNSAKTLGIASTIALGSTLGLAYFFMRYGGDYPSD